MPVWKMSSDAYAKIKDSERFHFIHLNATSHSADKADYHMTFSRNVAGMLQRELGIELIELHKLDHPAEASILPHEHLIATAKNAPGYN